MEFLKQAGENTYYFDFPSKIGLYVNGKDAFLIDSGNDESAGKKVYRVLEEKGLTLKAIINTHSHADHIGGNAFLQKKTGCEIFTGEKEVSFVNSPVIEPISLFAGNPPKELRTKFLLAQKSECVSLNENNIPSGLSFIELKGHTDGMIGVMTDDGVLFVADSVASGKSIEKYGITYVYDVKSFLETLDTLEKSECKCFVPSHAEVTDNITELTSVNRESVYDIVKSILEILETKKTFEELLSEIFYRYSMTMNFTQRYLIGFTVNSYLTYLLQEEKIDYQFEDNKMYWFKK